jgi:hypothetical protein
MVAGIMACNSWDKLCKVQRDYPKAKFADSFVQKSLKKSPKNPFLLVSNFINAIASLTADLLLGLESGHLTATHPRSKACGSPNTAGMAAAWTLRYPAPSIPLQTVCRSDAKKQHCQLLYQWTRQ